MSSAPLKGAGHLASSFVYLNNSARPEAARVRDKIDAFLTCYPRRRRKDLIARLRSANEIEHESAVFELVLHELLMRSNCQVLAVEPPIEGSERKPDFLVLGPQGERFYVEAVLATGISQADAAGERRLQEALDAIDAIETPDFFLSLRYRGVPSRPIRRNRLQRDVRQWIAGLNYQTIRAAWEAGELGELPRLELEEQDARFVMEPIPRVEARGQRAARALGVYGADEAMVIEAHAAIKAAIATPGSARCFPRIG